MEKKRKIGRKSFAAREDLLDDMTKIAKQGELSLYRFLNDMFEQILRANALEVNLRDLIDSRELLKAAKDNGFTLGLERLWYEMSEIAYSKSKRGSLQSWYDAGVWSAKRYTSGDHEDPFEAFKTDLKDFTWNVPEFEVNKQEDKISVRIVSPRFTESYTFLFTSFLEGALETFEYKIENKDVSRGIICLEAVKQ